MDKAFLKEIGISDEDVTKIINNFNETIKGEYVPLSRFNEVNAAKKNAEATVKTMTTQLDELKKINPEQLQAEIERLKSENEAEKVKFEAELKSQKLNNALDKALSQAKAKNLQAVKAFFKLDELELDGDNIKDIDKQIKALADDEKTGFLFEKTENTGGLKGVDPADPDRGNGKGTETPLGETFAQRYNAKWGVSNATENKGAE